MAAVPTSSPFPITNLTGFTPLPQRSFQIMGLAGNLQKVLGVQYFAGKILIIGKLWDQTPRFFSSRNCKILFSKNLRDVERFASL
jgi:hypothetical protein